jgi:pSer/pThr/pTyr-binding forkhead associated (FHA) protein
LETFTLPGGEIPPPATTEEEEEGGAESPAEAATEVPEEDEATPEPEEGGTETVEPEEAKSWLEDNLMLVIGIAVVLLLLIVALIGFLVMRGRNNEEQEEWNASPSTVQSVTPYPSQAGPVTQEQNFSAGGESNATADHTKVGYGYPSGPQAMDDRGVYPQTEHVGPVPPVGQGGTVPANPISPIPPTQAIPSANLSGESEPSAPNKTVIFTRPGAKKKPTPYLLRQEDNQRFELVSKRIFIGRSSDNGIHLNNETVSGKHAVIVKREDDILIQDTGSTNGTFINEEEVKGRLLLKQGDLIRFGQVEMIFHTGEETNERAVVVGS